MRFYFWCLFCCVSLVSQHVWNVVSCNSAVQCQLSHTFENGFSFVDTEGNEITGFIANKTYQFGLVLTPNATFEMLYTIACKQLDCNFPKGPCSRSVFIVSANGPGLPNVTTVNYQNATGSWNVNKSYLQFNIHFFFTHPPL